MPERNEHSAALSAHGIIDACGKAWADNWKMAYVTLGLDCVRPWWSRLGLSLSPGAEDVIQAAARGALEDLVKNNITVDFFEPDYDAGLNQEILSGFIERTREGLDEKNHRRLLEWAAFDYCTEAEKHIFEVVWKSTLMNIRHRHIDPEITPSLDRNVAAVVESVVAKHVTPETIRAQECLREAVGAPDSAWDRFALEHIGDIDNRCDMVEIDVLFPKISEQINKIEFRNIWAELCQSLSQAQLQNLYDWHRASATKMMVWPDHIRYPRTGPPVADP